nr:MAG TPA: hypothetical protein [Caudoviricetes sp.]DAW48206.1 MAG TPA: hypothetical protein [Caudoviricetes sp.]
MSFIQIVNIWFSSSLLQLSSVKTRRRQYRVY